MDARERLRDIREWIAQLPDGAEDVLASLREEMQTKRAQMERIQRDLDEVEEQMMMIEGAVMLRRRMDARIGATAPEPEANGKPARGREAVMWLVRHYPPDREWRIAEIVRELAANGLAEADDEHAVSVSLSRLFRAGELYRPRKGVYRLAPPPDLGTKKPDPPIEADGSQETAGNRLFIGSTSGEAEN